MLKGFWTIWLTVALLLTPGLAADRQEFTPSVKRDGIQRVEIIGGSYFFKPDYLILRINVPVEVKVRSEPGIIPHNLIIKSPEAGLEVNVDLSTDPQVIHFTPTKIGKYPFYCDKKFLFFESHREKGMEGIIEVRD